MSKKLFSLMLILLIMVMAISIREHLFRVKEVKKVEKIEQKLEELEIRLRVNQAFNEEKLDRLLSEIKKVQETKEK